jgi:protein involved in polysaccharide export with SLBB domain
MLTMSRVPSVLWAVFALAVIVPSLARANVAAPPASSTRSVEESYQLGTGDKVRIIVFGEEDLGGEFHIDGNGRISLPLVGEVKAAGETAAGLEQEIAAKLSEGYLQNPRVSVEISLYRPFYVIGEVNKPGEYPYVNDMSALNAIALAGGYSPRANEGVIYIRRNGSTKEEWVPADQMTLILPGDVVRIPISFFWTVMSVAGPLTSAAAAAVYAAP